MAAGAWKVFPRAKLKIGQGVLTLGSAIMNLALHSVGASANLLSNNVSTWGSIGSECTGGGYTAGGNTLSTNTWALSGVNAKFDSSDWVVTGAINSIKYAVIFQSVAASSGFPICYSTLTATQLSLGAGNTLTIQMAAAGIFTLS